MAESDDFTSEGRGLPVRDLAASPLEGGWRDVTDELADPKKRNHRIYFYHIPTGDFVSFKAFISRFSDNFESQWTSQEVYGRMDPIEVFQGTKRIITLDWDVPSIDIHEAKLNLAKADKLINMLYPTYDDYGNAGSISSSPLFRVKFANLIRQPGAEGDSASNVKIGGLVGRVAGFNYTPDIEPGFFAEGAANTKFYPQTIKFTCEFRVFHVHPLGWRSGEVQKGFPHGMLEGSSGSPPGGSRDRRQTAASTAIITAPQVVHEFEQENFYEEEDFGYDYESAPEAAYARATSFDKAEDISSEMMTGYDFESGLDIPFFERDVWDDDDDL